MNTQFFALEPAPTDRDRILELKRRAGVLAGPQLYLNDAPHLTLYVGDFANQSELWHALMERLKFSGIVVKPNGWKIFYNDPVTGGHTLAIGVDDAATAVLRRFQQEVVELAAPARRTAIPERYADRTGYSPLMNASLDRYGFPFVGENWQAHLTIASFCPEVFSEVWAQLRTAELPSRLLLDTFALNAIKADGYCRLCAQTVNGSAPTC